MEQKESNFDKTKLSLTSYGAEVNLSGIKMEASDLGTLLHRCYHVLLVDKALGERLFSAFNGKLPQNVWDQMQNQVASFKDYSKNELKAVKIQCEVPILSKTEQGSVLSGSIDLLLETEEGYWIIDHKSDKVLDFTEQFTHHYPQLEAYARCTKLNKPLLGVGINWVRYGKVMILEN